MPLAPEGTKRNAENAAWCVGCGRAVVILDGATYVLSGPDRCTVGPRAGQFCLGGGSLCPECEMPPASRSASISCPVCGDDDADEDDDAPECGVCDRDVSVPCPVCRPTHYARRVARATEPARWATPAPVQPVEVTNLPTYRRFLEAWLAGLRTEMQTAVCTATRLEALAGDLTAALDTLTAAGADADTRGEATRTAQTALAAADTARALLAALGETRIAVEVARTGLDRHAAVQEAHDSGAHLDRSAYHGS